MPVLHPSYTYEVREILSPGGRDIWEQIRALRKKTSSLITSTLEDLPREKPARERALEKFESARRSYEEEIASLERKLKVEEPKFASLFAGSTALDPADLSRVLEEGELLLRYIVFGKNVVVFVWDRAKGLDLHVLEVDAQAFGKEVVTTLLALRRRGEVRGDIRPLRALDEAPEAMSQLKKSLARLREKLFRGLESRVEAARGLVVVPDSFLHFLPWEALVLEDGRYLIEKCRVRYAPSIHVLLELDGRKKRKAEKSLVIFGDPDFGERPPDRPEMAVAVRGGREFGELQHAAREVKAVSRLFRKSTVVLRERRRATEGRFKRESGRGTILHVATHGRFGGVPASRRLPLFFSGLVFAGYNRGGVGEEDGFLSAGEVMGLDLRAVELAVLSACETAAGAVHGSEGKFGLERAFFVAGVRTFVGSLWQVDDRATSDLMRSFYKHLREKGITKAEALRRAKLEFISGRHKVTAATKSVRKTEDSRSGDGDRGFKRVPKGTRDLSHPYYWAPFILSGEGTGIR